MTEDSRREKQISELRELATTALALEALSNGLGPDVEEVWELLGRWVPPGEAGMAVEQALILFGRLEGDEFRCDVTTLEFSTTSLPETVRVRLVGVDLGGSDPSGARLDAIWGDGTQRALWLGGVIEVRDTCRKETVFPKMGKRWTDDLVTRHEPLDS